MLKFFIVIFTFLLLSEISAQNQNKIDSIKLSLGNQSNIQLSFIYNKIANDLLQTNPDSSLMYAKQALNAARNAKNKFEQAVALTIIGKIRTNQNDCENALNQLFEANNIFDELIKESPENKSYQTEKANTVNSIGINYNTQAVYDKALDYYLKALKLYNLASYKEGITKVYNNIGVLYENLNEATKAQEYYEKSLALNKELGYKKGIAASLNNLGNISMTLNNYDKALEYFEKSLDLKKQMDDKKGISSALSNLGNFYFYIKKYDKSLEYFENSLNIDLELGNAVDIATMYENIANVYQAKTSYDKAFDYYSKSLAIADSVKYWPLVQNCYLKISEIYTALCDYQKALEYFKKYEKAEQTNLNKQKFKNISELEKKYETQKKEQELKINEERLKKQEIFIVSLIIGSVLFILLAVLAFNQFRIKRNANKLLIHQNEEINRQKNEIEAQRDEIQRQRDYVTEQRDKITSQNKAIVDSINYASYIQSAVLPPLNILTRYFKDNFVLYMPRDIVSGDFYWFYEKGPEIIVAAADCTGHGVPGAFLSMLGITFLNEIVSKNDKLNAGEILDHLRNKIIKSLHQVEKSMATHDGMDIALCIVNVQTKQMQYAGANRPLYIIRKNNDAYELNETKANVMLGMYLKNCDQYTNHHIPLQHDDAIYIFSDGYCDQFNESTGKKYKPLQLKGELLKICSKPMEKQKHILSENFAKWKGKLEQLDDVMMIGLRI